MGSIITKAAFLPPRPPNRVDTPDLLFVETRSKIAIPVLHIKYTKRNDSTTSRFTILYSHGNAEDLGIIQEWMYRLSRKLRVDIIAYDYVGYGLSYSTQDRYAQLHPSEHYCYESIDAVYNYALAQGIPKDRLIAMGRSLGSGPTTDLASRKEVRAVILQSPFMSAVRVIMKTLFTLPIDIFANCDKIHKIKAPIFIMHGHQDNVVPFENGKQLQSFIPEKYAYQPWWIDGASHNDIKSKFYQEYIKRVDDFLTALEYESTPTKPISEKDQHDTENHNNGRVQLDESQ